MAANVSTIPELIAAVRSWASANYPGFPVEYVTIHLLRCPTPIRLPAGLEMPATPAPATAASATVAAEWEPTDYQARILEALEYRALRSEALVGELGGDRRRLWKPGGVKELVQRGLVVLDASAKRLGYYRPDAPPEELATP